MPNLDDTKTITQPGAEALRVHFESIATETDGELKPCPRGNGGCDNIYLYDAGGRLYQILFGMQANVTSVAIPGDTVKVRLVSDVNIGKSGYHIDRVDVLSNSKIFGDSFEAND